MTVRSGEAADFIQQVFNPNRLADVPIHSRRQAALTVASQGMGCHRNNRNVNAFHEKAGRSQVGFFCFTFHWQGFVSAWVATVAILPSALWLSDFRSVQVGRSRFSRCCQPVLRPQFPFVGMEVGPGFRRSHRNPACELCFSPPWSFLIFYATAGTAWCLLLCNGS